MTLALLPVKATMVLPPANPYEFGADYSANWTLQQVNADCTVVQAGSQAIRVTAGVSDAVANALMLWCKTRPGNDWAFEFFYTWEDGLAGIAGGRFTQFIESYNVKTGYPANPNNWTAADYSDMADATLNSRASSGYRGSFNTKSTDLTSENELRHRHYDGSDVSPIAFGPTVNAFNFVLGTRYRIQVVKSGRILTWTKIKADLTGATESVVVDDAVIDSKDGGYIGFKFVTRRKCLLDNFQAFEPGEPPEPPEPPGWPEPKPLADVLAGDRTNITAGGTYNGGSGGKHFVLTQNVTNGTFTMTGNGTKVNPILLRGNSDSTNPDLWPLLNGGTINLRGNFCWIYRLRLKNVKVIAGESGSPATGFRMCRCACSGRLGGYVSPMVGVRYGIDGCIDCNDFATFSWGGRMMSPVTGAEMGDGLLITRNLFEDFSQDTISPDPPGGQLKRDNYCLRTGGEPATTAEEYGVVIRANLFRNNGSASDLVEMKSSRNVIDDNTLENNGAKGFQIRHGQFTIISNNKAVSGNPWHDTRGGDHTHINNQGGTVRLWAGNLPAVNWTSDPDYDEYQNQAKVRPATTRCKAGGNSAVILGTFDNTTDSHVPASNHIVAPQNSGSGGHPVNAGRVDRNGTVTLVAGKVTGTDSNTAVADAKFNKTLNVYTRATIGIRFPYPMDGPPPPPPSDFVKVAPTIGLTGDVVRPTLIDGQDNIITATVNNRHYDLRDQSVTYDYGVNGHTAPLLVWNAQGTAITGLRCIGNFPLDMPWDICYDWGDPKVHAGVAPDGGLYSNRNASTDYNLIVENIRMENFWDGIRIGGSYVNNEGNAPWIVRGSYFKGVRDDTIQADLNDGNNYAPGLIEDVLADGCFVFLSYREGGSNNPVGSCTIRNCLVRMRPMPFTVDRGGDAPPADSLVIEDGISKGHGQVFKLNQINQTTGTSWITPTVIDCIFRVDRLSVNGPTSMVFPTNGTYTHVLILWFGEGNYPGVIPSSGVTVVKGTGTYLGRTKEQIWDQERANWLIAHGCTDGNGDDFPFLHIP